MWFITGGTITAVKAKLTVILEADEVVVAEVQDPVLWQHALTVIHVGKPDLPGPNLGAASSADKLQKPKDPVTDEEAGPLGSMALQLGLDPAQLQGACSPQAEAPHMHLDAHCWEEMKQQLPSRGPLAVSPIVVDNSFGVVVSKGQLRNSDPSAGKGGTCNDQHKRPECKPLYSKR